MLSSKDETTHLEENVTDVNSCPLSSWNDFIEDKLPSQIPSEYYTIPGKVSSQAQDFLKSLLSVDPLSRPGCREQIASHPWMSTDIDWDRVEAGTATSSYVPQISGPWDASCFQSTEQNPNYDEQPENPHSFREEFHAFY